MKSICAATILLFTASLEAAEDHLSWTHRKGQVESAASVVGVKKDTNTYTLFQRKYTGMSEMFSDVAMLGGGFVRIATVSSSVRGSGNHVKINSRADFDETTIYSVNQKGNYSGLRVYSPDFFKTKRAAPTRNFMVGTVPVRAKPMFSVVLRTSASYGNDIRNFNGIDLSCGADITQTIKCSGRLRVVSGRGSSKKNVWLNLCSMNSTDDYAKHFDAREYGFYQNLSLEYDPLQGDLVLKAGNQELPVISWPGVETKSIGFIGRSRKRTLEDGETKPW